MKTKNKMLWALSALLVLGGCSSSATTTDDTAETESAAESHLYDNVEVIDAVTGSGKVNGQYAYAEAESADCTLEAVTDFYYNYWVDSGTKWAVIKYTDVDDKGVFINSGSVEINATMEDDGMNGYYVTDSEGESEYWPDGEGALLTWEELTADND